MNNNYKIFISILLMFLIVLAPITASANAPILKVVATVFSVAVFVYSGFTVNPWTIASFFTSVVKLDSNSCQINLVFGCNDPPPNNANNLKDGKLQSCPAGQKICGNGCIPTSASCCANIGVTNQYCPSGNYCVSDGGGGANCQANGTGTAQCSDLYTQGKECISPKNSCNLFNKAKYLCDGSCEVPSAPADSSCPLPQIALSYKRADGVVVNQSKQTVQSGSSCTVNWSVTNATSCSLTDSSGTVASGLSGTYKTPALKDRSASYNLTCKNGDVVTAASEFICQLVPTYQEVN